MLDQRAKKVMSDSPGLVDFAIGLVIFKLPDCHQVLFFGEIQITEGLSSTPIIKEVLGLVEMTCGLVHTSYSLPEWQAVKLTFFAPYRYSILNSIYSFLAPSKTLIFDKALQLMSFSSSQETISFN